MGHKHGSTEPGVWSALDELVTDVVDTRAQIAALQAKEATLLAAAVDLVIARTQERRSERRRFGNDLALREVCAELGAAMRVSDRTVQARIGDAATLVTSFPATLEALRKGRIDDRHVQAIIDPGVTIGDPEARARYERLVLEAAKTESATRLRPIARVIADRIDPDGAEDRRKGAQSTRRVRVIDLDDGMARLTADLPATLAYAIHDRLTRMAHHLRRNPDVIGVPDATGEGGGTEESAEPAADGAVVVTTRPGNRVPHDDAQPQGADAAADQDEAGDQEEVDDQHDAAITDAAAQDADTRTMDQLRADILADLLLAAAPTAHGTEIGLAAINGHVQVMVPVLTLAGRSNQPALLAGYGPIDEETARRLAGGATGWDRVMTHPHTGAPMAVDRYRPSADLQRFLRARDERCRTVGCTQPVWRCDVDHTIDAAKGGQTCEWNLANFCKRHHILKHGSEWTVRQLGGGVFEWRSPTGRRYLDKPPAMVQFVPDPAYEDDPPPF